jgi:hypothetical protein
MEIMEAGNVWEHQTGKALVSKLNGSVHWKRDDPALRVGNDVWSGHIDFLIDPCQELPDGAIIGHKARNPVNFVRKGKMEYTLPGDVRGAKQRHLEASAEDRRYRDYLLHKYDPQPMELG